MILIPLGVIWLGYTLGWYGFTNLKGPGIGIADLIIPSRVTQVDAQLQANLSGTIYVPDLTPAQLNAPGGKVINPATGLTQAPPGWHYDPIKNIMVGP